MGALRTGVAPAGKHWEQWEVMLTSSMAFGGGEESIRSALRGRSIVLLAVWGSYSCRSLFPQRQRNV